MWKSTNDGFIKREWLGDHQSRGKRGECFSSGGLEQRLGQHTGKPGECVVSDTGADFQPQAAVSRADGGGVFQVGDDVTLVQGDEPRPYVDRRHLPELTRLHHRELGGAPTDVDIEDRAPSLQIRFASESIARERALKRTYPYVQFIVLRVLELTYTSEEMKGFANDLGFDGPPFSWDDERRHCLRCELDAIFAQMYGLTRSDLEWILDAQAPSSSFPSLKQNEKRSFGEYRTQRYVLQAFDSLENGQLPNLNG